MCLREMAGPLHWPLPFESWRKLGKMKVLRCNGVLYCATFERMLKTFLDCLGCTAQMFVMYICTVHYDVFSYSSFCLWERGQWPTNDLPSPEMIPVFVPLGCEETDKFVAQKYPKQVTVVSQMLAVWTTYKRWLQSVESVKLCNVKTPMLFIFENYFAFSPVITGNVFYSSCLPPNTTHSWEFNGLTYTALSVSTDIGAVYDECRSITKRYINDMNVHSPPEVYSMKFYAMSYFWTRGSEVHLIGERLFVSLSS